jgi:hypothetical protein
MSCEEKMFHVEHFAIELRVNSSSRNVPVKHSGSSSVLSYESVRSAVSSESCTVFPRKSYARTYSAVAPPRRTV